MLLVSSNFLLLGSELDIVYTKNTCHRTYNGRLLSTDEDRKWCGECTLSRLEVYDKIAKKYIASIAYHPRTCSIEYLSVDHEYRKKGIGAGIAHRAVEDMRAMDGCREIFVLSAAGTERFWEKLGAKPTDAAGFTHVFDPSSN